MLQRKELYVLNTKRYVWGKSNPTYHWVPLFIFSSMVVAASCYGYSCHRQRLGRILGVKNNCNIANHRQNPRGKPGSVYFPTDTGRQIHLSAEQ